ncbi:MAG TPA: secretion protein HlyD [Pirellulales bacterium]|jgi:HlyD family secretion protein|nr:secretion protein HlyD [Pirellulales bacterium]
MSSTKEDPHQPSVKHAPPKHAPAEPPMAPPASRSGDQLRHSFEGKTAVVSAAQAAESVAAAGPLRWVLLLLGVAILGLVGFGWYHASHPAVDPRHLVLQGNIDVRQVNLAFKVAGRIATLEVDEGDTVTAGQTVATLDKQYFEDDLRAVTAQRESAKATLEKLLHGSRPEEIAGAEAQVVERQATLKRALQDYTRAEGLVGKGAISREDFDAAHSTLQEAKARLTAAEQSRDMILIGPRQEDITVARAQLAAEEASVIQSERRLADSILVAPSDGVVLTRAREKGAIVSPGETIFALTLSSPVWVRTYVNERDLGRIEPGMKAQVRTDSAPDRIYAAQIGFISPVAEFTPKAVETRELRTDLVYRLRVLVDNPDGGLRQGMPVSVTIDVGQKD